MSSKEHELQDFHDLMEEINAQFVALIDPFSIPEDLQRKIDSIARYLLNVIYPLLDPDTYFRLVELMNLFLHCQNYSREGSPEHASIAGDSSLLPVVAKFLRRIKEELDSQAVGLFADSKKTLSSL